MKPSILALLFSQEKDTLEEFYSYCRTMHIRMKMQFYITVCELVALNLRTLLTPFANRCSSALKVVSFAFEIPCPKFHDFDREGVEEAITEFLKGAGFSRGSAKVLAPSEDGKGFLLRLDLMFTPDGASKAAWVLARRKGKSLSTNTSAVTTAVINHSIHNKSKKVQTVRVDLKESTCLVAIQRSLEESFSDSMEFICVELVSPTLDLGESIRVVYKKKS